MIDGSTGPLNHSGWKMTRPAHRSRTEPAGVDKAAEPGSATSSGAPSNSPSEIHRTEALREAASQLLARGDLDASKDGQTRPSRISLVQERVASGAYDRREVLDHIVDRLIEQWEI